MSKPNKRRSVTDQVRELRRRGLRLLAPARWMVERVELAVGAVLRATFFASEQLESIDSVLATVGRVLLAPWRGAAGLLRQLIPRPIFAAAARFGSSLWSLARRTVVAGRRVTLPVWGAVLPILGRALWPLWRPVVAIVGFARAWFVTRSQRQVAWGLPALLLLLPVACLGFVGAPHENKAIVARYRSALETASKVGDLPRANLYERKLQQLGISTARQAYERALTLAASGQLADAYRGMSELAPGDECGYPPAHYWIAQQAFAGELTGAKERGELVDRHLARLQELGQTDGAVQLLAGLRLTERGEFEAARQKLEPLADDVPMAAATLLRLDLQLRRDDQIRHDAAAVVRHLQQQQSQGRVFGPADYSLMSVALQIVGDAEAERERLLAEWSERYPHDPQAARELLRFVEAKFERLVRASGSSPDELARLIQRAANLGTQSEWLGAQFQQLYAVRDLSVVANPLPEQVVNRLLADETTSPAVLSALGVQAARAAEWGRAEACFGRVTKCEPANAVAWNNFAWVVLQQRGNARLEEARRLVDRALELEPKNYRFRETRGQIWLRLGHWERARADLEFAKSGMPETPSLEAALASVYAALGGQSPGDSSASPAEKD